MDCFKNLRLSELDSQKLFGVKEKTVTAIIKNVENVTKLTKEVYPLIENDFLMEFYAQNNYYKKLEHELENELENEILEQVITKKTDNVEIDMNKLLEKINIREKVKKIEEVIQNIEELKYIISKIFENLLNKT